MTLTRDNEVRNVGGLATDAAERIGHFLQGAVYCWCKNRPDEWFALRDLMGGDNTEWQGTPLQPLYDRNLPSPDAFSSAAKDAGWLLKGVLENDARQFDTEIRELVRHYRWIGSGAGP